jgi:mono/diheme cytochrome c family protein
VKIPVSLRIAALAIATTAFYTYVGQLVPQKEVHPPVEMVLSKDMGPAEMQRVGREIMDGKGLCFTCHTIGKSGALRFPDLAGIGSRAGSRIPGYTDLQYLAESLVEPDKYLVPGFNPGMPIINKPPIGLTDDEMLAVIAYLQSLGGTTTVTMQTKLPWMEGAEPATAEAAP